MLNQEDRDMLREAQEFIMAYANGEENYENSIEKCQAYASEHGVPDSISLYGVHGGLLGYYLGKDFMNINVDDLDKDNYIEKSRKVNKIVVTYGDETSDEYADLIAAEKGIAETINGCDLAVNIENIEGYVGDEHVCNYTAEMVARLTVQPAV